MFSGAQRLFLVLMTGVVGVLLVARGTVSGWALLLASGLWAFGYFAYGTVPVAFRHLQHGDIDRTRRILGQTRFPRLLTRRTLAYREWILGSLALHEGDLERGASHFREANEIGTRTFNDQAVVALLLAEVELELGHQSQAMALLTSAAQMPCTPATKERILELSRAVRDSE